MSQKKAFIKSDLDVTVVGRSSHLLQSSPVITAVKDAFVEGDRNEVKGLFQVLLGQPLPGLDRLARRYLDEAGYTPKFQVESPIQKMVPDDLVDNTFLNHGEQRRLKTKQDS